MTYRVAGQRITAPDAGGHGLGISDGQSWLVEDSIIDLSACPLERLDEAAGITWGSRAIFRRCVIRGRPSSSSAVQEMRTSWRWSAAR